MNIIEIEIQNNKHIRCFRKRLDGKNMIVAGDTGTGKTTAISALWDIMKKCPDALTHGEKKGIIKVKLSDGSKVINAVRTTTAKASSITITDHEGDDINITDFKGMISTLSVDPHLIAAMKPTEQLATLATAAGIEGLATMEANIKQAESDRLDLFRAMEAIAPGEEPEKVEAVDVSALVAEKHEADSKNSERDRKLYDLNNMVERGTEANADIERLGAELKTKIAAQDRRRKGAETLKAEVATMKHIDTADLMQRIETIKADLAVLETAYHDAGVQNSERDRKIYDLDSMVERDEEANEETKLFGTELKAKIAANDELRTKANALKDETAAMVEIDTTAIVTSINNAQTTNDAAAAHRNWTSAVERHEAKVCEHSKADANVKQHREKKKSALANAQWPIEGLTIDDGNILYNDCLLSNLGDSQQLLVCAAIAVKGIAAKPIKVVRMDRVESMSPTDLAALEKVFNDQGVQVLATRVTWGDTRPEEIVITEGVYSDAE